MGIFRRFKHLAASEKRLTLSTWFTIARIILVPFIVGAMVHQRWGLAFWLFVSAALTDLIDGGLARWLDQKTFLGACLDPIADKFLILSCFFTLAFVQSPLFSIPLWFVLLVLTRETIIIVGALIIYMTRGRLDVQPTLLGKLTTLVQVCFIVWLFACYFFQWLPIKTYFTMLAVVVFMVLSTLVQYVRMGLEQFRSD